MSPTQRREATAWMVARMQVGEFSFSQLHTGCAAALGSDVGYYRLADQTIQAQRKLGTIALNSQRKWMWQNVA